MYTKDKKKSINDFVKRRKESISQLLDNACKVNNNIDRNIELININVSKYILDNIDIIKKQHYDDILKINNNIEKLLRYIQDIQLLKKDISYIIGVLTEYSTFKLFEDLQKIPNNRLNMYKNKILKIFNEMNTIMHNNNSIVNKCDDAPF